MANHPSSAQLRARTIVRVRQAYHDLRPHQPRCMTPGPDTSEQSQNLRMLSAERSDTISLPVVWGSILPGAALIVIAGGAFLRSLGNILGANEQQWRRLVPISGPSVVDSRRSSRFREKPLILPRKRTAPRGRPEAAFQIKREYFTVAAWATPWASPQPASPVQVVSCIPPRFQP